MFRPLVARAAALALFVPLAAAAAGAQSPDGFLSFTGTANAQDLGRPGVALDFTAPVTLATSGNTGSFATFNRRSGAAVTGTIADVLVGRGAPAIPAFLAVGGYTFNLAPLPSGPFRQTQCYVAPAAGQTCSPYQSELGRPVATDPISPFYMANLRSGNAEYPINAYVAFNLFGTVTGPGGATSNFFGTIGTTFYGASYQEVLGGLEYLGGMGTGFPDITFTGRFYATAEELDDDAALVAFPPEGEIAATVTPEPGTWALTAAGVAVLGGLARRRRRTA